MAKEQTNIFRTKHLIARRRGTLCQRTLYFLTSPAQMNTIWSPRTISRPARFQRRFIFPTQIGSFDGGRTRARTWDPLIKNQLLYQLSYAPIENNRVGHGVGPTRTGGM